MEKVVSNRPYRDVERADVQMGNQVQGIDGQTLLELL
jgi:hypothetical protein